MKKLLSVILIIILLLTGTLAGCNNGDTSTTSGTTSDSTTTEKPFEGVTIRYVGSLTGVEELLPAFEEETGIKVELTSLAMTDLYSKLDVEFGAQTSSFDVVNIMWAAGQGYMRAGHLIELDDYMEKYDVDPTQYARVYVDNHMFQYPETEDGVYIGLPQNASLEILVYRADLFEDPEEMANFKARYGYDLAPPETYDQFLDVSAFFTRDTDGDGENDMWGTSVKGANTPQLVGDITAYLRAHGGDWVDDEFRPVINSPESIEGIQYYYDLWANGLTPPAANTYSYNDAVSDYLNGKIAMLKIWSGGVKDLEDTETSSVAGKNKYSVVPGKNPTVGGWMVSIPKYSDNQEAAFLFANWLTCPETALARARNTGYGTGAAIVYTDTVMREKYNYLEAFDDSLAYGKGWPQVGEFTSIWQLGAEELSRLFAGEITVQQAADNMQERMDKLMRDGGYYE